MSVFSVEFQRRKSIVFGLGSIMKKKLKLNFRSIFFHLWLLIVWFSALNCIDLGNPVYTLRAKDQLAYFRVSYISSFLSSRNKFVGHDGSTSLSPCTKCQFPANQSCQNIVSYRTHPGNVDMQRALSVSIENTHFQSTYLSRTMMIPPCR